MHNLTACKMQQLKYPCRIPSDILCSCQDSGEMSRSHSEGAYANTILPNHHHHHRTHHRVFEDFACQEDPSVDIYRKSSLSAEGGLNERPSNLSTKLSRCHQLKLTPKSNSKPFASNRKQARIGHCGPAGDSLKSRPAHPPTPPSYCRK